jgi:hypothetical protein
VNEVGSRERTQGKQTIKPKRRPRMNTKIFIAILLLLMAISTIYASEDPTEQAEYLQKKQQLDLLAERFKAETGFKGDIETNFEHMKLSRFTGNFDDIDMTNVRDSVAFRQVCNTVISKLLPFIGAKSEQLTPGRINVDSHQIDTRYYQIVNGYKEESGGYLNIYYLCEQKRFGILNVTAEISSELLGKVISQEEAFRIARINFEQTEYCNKLTPESRSRTTILYKSRVVNGEAQPYRLCWRVVFPGLVYYIDAITSEFYTEKYVTNDAYRVSVKGNRYGEDSNFQLTGCKPMAGIEVINGDYQDFTNQAGEISLPNPPDNSYQVSMLSDRFSIWSEGIPEILHINGSNAYTQIDSLYYESCLEDSIASSINAYSYYAPNIFHHIAGQDSLFCKLSNDFSAIGYPNIINDCHGMGTTLGLFDPLLHEIRVASGLNSHVIRHEASHFFTYYTTNFHQFFESTNPINEKLYQAMDESFAEYWLSIGIRSTTHNYGIPHDILSYDVNDIHTFYNTQQLPLNEDFYSWFDNRYPIASTWWSLRNNPLFSLPNPVTEVNAFDDIIVKTLQQDVDPSFTSRYKPRYFYNLLMQRVADSGQTTGLNDKQRAIDAAYSLRGLHFNPKVESFSGGNKGRNVYNLGDPVYAMLSNFPQNTEFTLYVIDHNSYNYVDGGLVPTSSCYAQGFSPIYGTTDENGNYLFPNPIWTASTAGEYDIIVDIGSPTTPDGIIHFTFSAANVMDGIDGRTQPGFIVSDNGIDVVMAEQASAEAQIANAHQ